MKLAAAVAAAALALLAIWLWASAGFSAGVVTNFPSGGSAVYDRDLYPFVTITRLSSRGPWGSVTTRVTGSLGRYLHADERRLVMPHFDGAETSVPPRRLLVFETPTLDQLARFDIPAGSLPITATADAQWLYVATRDGHRVAMHGVPLRDAPAGSTAWQRWLGAEAEPCSHGAQLVATDEHGAWRAGPAGLEAVAPEGLRPCDR